VKPIPVKRTERGWAGHFICASRCYFRRNTLLGAGEVKIVISTVGMFFRDSEDSSPTTIGHNRHYETMAFHSKPNDTEYHDADVGAQVCFDSQWSLEEPYQDNEADKMHEDVVFEISVILSSGHPLLYNAQGGA
jgi:hypothetical protein